MNRWQLGSALRVLRYKKLIPLPAQNAPGDKMPHRTIDRGKVQAPFPRQLASGRQSSSRLLAGNVPLQAVENFMQGSAGRYCGHNFSQKCHKARGAQEIVQRKPEVLRQWAVRYATPPQTPMTSPASEMAILRGRPDLPSVGRTGAERRRVAEALRQWLLATLPRQCRDGSANDGAFAEDDSGWYVGRHAAYVLASLIAARVWEKEISADMPQLDEAIRRTMTFLLRRQRPDGRLDLNGTFSANEVGFTLPGLAAGYARLVALPEFVDVSEGLKEYLLRGAEAILGGSAHTANHRWAAACAPLASVHRLWPDARYLVRIEDYLADGIDCDEDGCWYIERSPNYNNVANQGLMILAEALDRPSLYEPVARNLDFMLHMLQPNGEADSSYSHRQDRAEPGRLPACYGVTRRMAQRTGDGRFTALAELVWSRSDGRKLEFIPLAFQLDDHPEPLPEPSALPVTYEKFFRAAGLLRRRDGATALTLSADAEDHFYSSVRDQWGGPRHSDDWFHFHHGDVVIQSLHLAGGGMANLQPDSLRPAGHGVYRLGGFMRGWQHPLHFRPNCPVVEMRWDWEHEIDVTWRGPAIELRIRSQTPHALPAILRLWLRAPVVVEETGGRQGVSLRAGEEGWLEGGSDVLVRGAKNALRIQGLPRSEHRLEIRHPQPIPSRMEQFCGCLSIGLTFPVDITFRIIPQSAEKPGLPA